MGPKTISRPTTDALSEREWDQLHEAVAAWRNLQRWIGALFSVVVVLTASIIGWGVSVEQRIATAQQIDRGRDLELTLLRERLTEIQIKIDKVHEAIVNHSIAHPGHYRLPGKGQ